ncbi:MAG: sigma-70 family RNA polymerase sigma factor [Pirellulaceae bacterium]|nr:sigma-70 family RNA polymerase sigma factor [Pirellulaceae bacterium]
MGINTGSRGSTYWISVAMDKRESSKEMQISDALLEVPREIEPQVDSVSRDAEPKELSEAQRRVWIEQLIADHHKSLYRFCYRLTGNATMAEDVLQQAYLIAFQRIGQVKDPAKARSWLFTVVRTTFLKEVRKKREWVFTDVEVEDNRVPDRSRHLEVDSQRLQVALDAIPETFRIAVVMHYQQQMSYREIAEQLEIPLGTVMSRLSRGKRMLKSKLLVTQKQFDSEE